MRSKGGEDPDVERAGGSLELESAEVSVISTELELPMVGVVVSDDRCVDMEDGVLVRTTRQSRLSGMGVANKVIRRPDHAGCEGVAVE